MMQIKAFFAAYKVAIYFALAALLLIGLGVIYCEGKRAGKSGEVIEQQEREIETQETISDADAKAADQRVIDARQSEQQKKELNDAIQATQDPDRTRALRGCVIMRQQNRDTSHIPACTRS